MVIPEQAGDGKDYGYGAAQPDRQREWRQMNRSRPDQKPAGSDAGEARNAPSLPCNGVFYASASKPTRLHPFEKFGRNWISRGVTYDCVDLAAWTERSDSTIRPPINLIWRKNQKAPKAATQ